MKTVILYTFHKYDQNVKFFIENGIFQDVNYKFILIQNIPAQRATIKETLKGYDLYKRRNIGFDFGAWSEILIDNNLVEEYDNFIFINGSCRGPFYKGPGLWTNVFLEKLNDFDRLIGTTINCANRNAKINPFHFPHVQSWFFCMRKDTLQFLLQKKIFTKNYVSDKLKLIDQYEIGMSRQIIRAGWNIACLMSDYQGIDFTWKSAPPDKLKLLGDVAYPGKYHGRSLDPYDVVFIKANRGISL